ncbi:MAG TPA: MBL fold metallo-hydrolase [Streptosporangiaceae bacterium]|jgi:ribonuclease BN (tRNA processing enzyme)
MPADATGVTVTFAGCGDAFGSGGRLQACIHLRPGGQRDAALLDCGATSLAALKRQGLDPNEIATVVVSHLHGDHFGGLPFLILDGQFHGRTRPLQVAGPPGIAARLRQAMEVMFPGSTGVTRRFEVTTAELHPGTTTPLTNGEVTAWQARHPSGAPPLIVRLDIGGRRIAYTGDTAWTDAIAAASDQADLLIAEAYTLDREIRHHLSLSTLALHRAELACGRVVLTHLSDDVLDHPGEIAFEAAHDGLTIHI